MSAKSAYLTIVRWQRPLAAKATLQQLQLLQLRDLPHRANIAPAVELLRRLEHIKF
jgi:hypothetical protein